MNKKIVEKYTDDTEAICTYYEPQHNSFYENIQAANTLSLKELIFLKGYEFNIRVDTYSEKAVSIIPFGIDLGAKSYNFEQSIFIRTKESIRGVFYG